LGARADLLAVVDKPVSVRGAIQMGKRLPEDRIVKVAVAAQAKKVVGAGCRAFDLPMKQLLNFREPPIRQQERLASVQVQLEWLHQVGYPPTFHCRFTRENIANQLLLSEIGSGGQVEPEVIDVADRPINRRRFAGVS